MAGLDHQISPLVQQDHTARYGCLNSPPPKEKYFVMAREYHGATYQMKLAEVLYTFSKSCRYDLSHTDPKCEGCCSVGLGKFYDEDIRSRGT